MKPEKITILNQKNEKLVGYFYKSESKRIIIICHGVESSNNFRIIPIRDAYHNYLIYLHRITGANIFSFDFSGFGESEGKFSLNLRQRDSEIKRVLDYFAKEYTDIVLYGFSLAGVSSGIAAIKYKMITKLITVNGFFTLNPLKFYFFHFFMIGGYLFMHPSFLLDIYFWIKNLKIKNITIPTLVLISKKDTMVNPKQSISFYDKLKMDKQFAIIESNDHAMVKENVALAEEISKWLNKYNDNV